MNTREKVLKEALKCVNGEREKQYGSPEDNFARIADFWGLYLTTLFEDTGVVVELDPKDVAIMMILFKIARSLGDQDKLDNYVDIIGYAACGAEIFEKSEATNKVLKKKEELGVQLADECKECDYATKCIGTGVCLKEKEKECINNGENILDNFADYINARVRKKTEEKHLLDKYSYARNKLYNYASIKASEEHVPLDNLKCLSDYLDQAVTDCVENGKRILECYIEIDEMFNKYRKTSLYLIKNKPDKKYDSCQAYNSITARISISSSKANINPFDVVEQLIRDDHAPKEMADQLMTGKLGFDDIASYIEDTVNKLKSKEDKK